MPWNERLKSVLQHSLEAGLIEHLARNYIPPKYLNLRDENETAPKPFTLDHFVLALGWLGVGLLAAAVALGIEMLGRTDK